MPIPGAEPPPRQRALPALPAHFLSATSPPKIVGLFGVRRPHARMDVVDGVALILLGNPDRRLPDDLDAGALDLGGLVKNDQVGFHDSKLKIDEVADSFSKTIVASDATAAAPAITAQAIVGRHSNREALGSVSRGPLSAGWYSDMISCVFGMNQATTSAAA